MAALAAALFAQASDRTPWATAVLGDRFAGSGSVIAATALALAVINTIGAVAGMLIAPHLAPNARALLLAFAIASAGLSALWPMKPPMPRTGKIGAFLGTLFSVLALGLGDRTQFLTMAIAARSPVPLLAAVGATIGALAVNVPAILAGEAGRRQLPMSGIRIAIGILMLLAGLWIGFGALGLI